MGVADLVAFRDRLAIGQGPYVASPTWTDITLPDSATANAVRAGAGSFATGRQNRNGSYEATAVTLTVGNRDGRYTPGYNASPYYPFDEACPYAREIEYPKGSGTWYPFWGGVLYDSSSGFEGAAQGVAQLVMQQRLALPGLQLLPAIAVGLIEKANPLGLWTFGEPADSERAYDSRGEDYPSLGILSRGTQGAIDFGIGDAPGPDSGGTRVAFTPYDNNDGYLLETTTLPGRFSEHESYAVISSPAYISGFWTANVIYSFTDSFTSGIKLEITSAGYLKAIVRDAFSGDLATVTSADAITGGADHVVGTTVSDAAGTSTLTLWIDGVSAGTATYTTVDWSMTRLDVGGAAGLSQFFNGTIANLAVWEDNDATGTRRDLFTDSLLGYSDDTADVRFARLADLAGIPADWVTTTGTFTRKIADQPTQGRAFIDLVKELEVAEIGRIFCDWQGRIGLASSSAYYEPAQVISLSASQFDLAGSFGIDADNMVNDWRGSRTAGIPQRYLADQGVIDKRGQKGADAGSAIPLTTDDDVLQIGHWTVNTTALPALRFPAIVVSLSGIAADTELVGQMIALAEGDQITLTDLPAAAPGTEFIGFVERVEKSENGDDLLWVVTLSQWQEIAEFHFGADVAYDAEIPYDSAIPYADPYAALSGVADRFFDDPGTMTTTGSLTDVATSIEVATDAGSPPFTDAADDLPFDISIGGERCTVTAVSASTSPQTLTITRGIAPTTAVAHDTAAAVSVWPAAVFGV